MMVCDHCGAPEPFGVLCADCEQRVCLDCGRVICVCPEHAWTDWVYHLLDPNTDQFLRLWQIARAVHWTTLQQAMGWPDAGRLRLLAALRGMP